MIPASITERDLVLIENGMEIMKAVELAFEQEQKFISEMIEQKTERSVIAKNQICKNVFGICNILNP